MGTLLKLTPDGAMKKCAGPIFGTANNFGDKFSIKVKNLYEDSFEGYLLKLTRPEARKLQRRLAEYLGEGDESPQPQRDER